MRRVITVTVLAALLLALAAAVAVTKTCSADPCSGTKNRDSLNERVGENLDDTILGKGDTISAYEWTDDANELFGNRGNDKLFANDDDEEEDSVGGGNGKDTWVVDESTTHPGPTRGQRRRLRTRGSGGPGSRPSQHRRVVSSANGESFVLVPDRGFPRSPGLWPDVLHKPPSKNSPAACFLAGRLSAVR